ncbi:ATP synthase subunit I [Methyloglobulus sp.]|uniref:ATP synthase subunit I n=1 Tax=Methyloglobulus sp. TaxID=2518622 RepID=UPI003988CD4E
MTASGSTTVAKILGYQVLIIMVVSFGFVVGGWQKALSSTLGGLAAFIPNLYFALRVSGSAEQEARKILRSFYVGESVKLLLTVALFILIFQIPSIEILPLLAGYIAALSVFWFALLIR